MADAIADPTIDRSKWTPLGEGELEEGEVELHATELVPGDVITGCRSTDSNWGFYSWRHVDGGVKVGKVRVGTTQKGEVAYGVEDEGLLREGRFTYRVRRAKPQLSDRFPHACPDCKKPAYVGFSSIEHAPDGRRECP